MNGLVQVNKTRGFLPKSVFPDFLRLDLAGLFVLLRGFLIKLFKSRRAFFLQLFSKCPICFSIWFYICSVIGEEPPFLQFLSPLPLLVFPSLNICLLLPPSPLPPPPSSSLVKIKVELKGYRRTFDFSQMLLCFNFFT